MKKKYEEAMAANNVNSSYLNGGAANLGNYLKKEILVF
jgi:hypothetical protein